MTNFTAVIFLNGKQIAESDLNMHSWYCELAHVTPMQAALTLMRDLQETLTTDSNLSWRFGFRMVTTV